MRWYRRLLVVGVCLASGAASAGERPQFTDTGALARSFVLPLTGRTQVLPYAHADLDLTLDLISEYHFDREGVDQILLDGETAQLTFQYRAGLGGAWEWGLLLPVFTQGGGFMDATIQSWHETLGLPDYGRGDAPTNRYQYRYVHEGQTVFDTAQTGTRLGDVQLSTGWRAGDGLYLRGALKLPTGDEAQLTGGNTGVALWADWAPQVGVRDFFLSGGVSWAEPGVLGEVQQRAVAFVGGGAALALRPGLRTFTQVYVHSPLGTDPRFQPLAKLAAPLSLGLVWQASPRWAVDFAMQEDLAVNASPDLSLRFGLRRTAAH